MKKMPAFLLTILFGISLLSGFATAAPPTVTILPTTGGSVSLIGYDLVISPHNGYYLSELTLDGQPVEPVLRLTLAENTNCLVHAVFEKIVVENPWENPYSDVFENDWFYDSVKCMDQNGILEGTGNSLFSPQLTLNRAMLVTMLYRLEGSPEIPGLKSFDDVEDGLWYTSPVAWATASGIVTGYEDGLFRPLKDISRQEIAMIMFRFAVYKGYDVSAAGDVNAYIDYEQISDWAEDALIWAVGSGVITGKGGGILDPAGYAKRCEASEILMRFMLLYQ